MTLTPSDLIDIGTFGEKDAEIVVSDIYVKASKVADELREKLNFWKDCNLTYKEQLGMLKTDIEYIIDTLDNKTLRGNGK